MNMSETTPIHVWPKKVTYTMSGTAIVAAATCYITNNRFVLLSCILVIAVCCIYCARIVRSRQREAVEHDEYDADLAGMTSMQFFFMGGMMFGLCLAALGLNEFGWISFLGFAMMAFIAAFALVANRWIALFGLPTIFLFGGWRPWL